jgi:16S rRNA C967 or C1407 C5-methylase (RsmB/RsmF family)/NOL1/NOP2/fmu family ribosome biogenesis protein
MSSLPFPSGFTEHLAKQTGVHQQTLLEVLNTEAPASIRLNKKKAAPAFDNQAAIPWSTSGRYLKSRPAYHLDPNWHAGAYYVQEASSMFVEHVMKQLSTGERIRVLDLCAAPGGKSLIVSDSLADNSLLVSNEVIKTRVPVLRENTERWGAVHTLITSQDAKDFQRLPAFFDIILVDAPCSGSGLFRKEPESRKEWSMDNVLHCAERQGRILNDVMPALQANGFLIYATCSYSHEENEAQMDWLLSSFPCASVQIPVPPHWGIVETVSEQGAYGYRFYPDQLQGEGFFLSVLQLQEAIPASITPRDGNNAYTPVNNEMKLILQQHVCTPFEASFVFSKEGNYHMIPKALLDSALLVSNRMAVKYFGVEIGSMKGPHFIPAHGLAMSSCYATHTPVTEVSLENAWRYLRREDLSAELFPDGWSLISYAGNILGWIKKIPHRINNYYPMGYRLRK